MCSGTKKVKVKVREREREREREPLPPPPSTLSKAFREGGEDGVVEGLAPMERRLPPPEGLGGMGE